MNDINTKRYIIRKDEIPTHAQAKFKDFVQGRGCPVIVGEECYWRIDYMEFFYGVRSLELYDKLEAKKNTQK